MNDSRPIELPASFDIRAEVLADTLNRESDRGCAIIGAEITSDRLESLLRAFLRSDAQSKKQVDPLFKGFGPLSTFSARIQMAYVMYLIPKIIRDRLEMMRKIRNHFAHSPAPASFTDCECRETLHILATGKFRVSDTAASGLNGDTKKRRTVPKERFYYICAVAQTATIIELLETLLRKHGDVRQIVLHYEKTGAFEYDKDAA
ncbi:MAG: MltR family transcriptional regulator [Verrucomicrobiota bacterium]